VVSYEVLLMLDPELADERQLEIVTRMREQIERSGGSWSTHDAWGRRRLAYEIDKKNEGAYHLVTFQSEPEALDEMSRVLRISDGVMRHLAVRRIEGSRTGAPAAPREERPERPERGERGERGDRGDRGERTSVGSSGYPANTRSQEEE
jgi:small subunit ribosomal protein S6